MFSEAGWMGPSRGCIVSRVEVALPGGYSAVSHWRRSCHFWDYSKTVSLYIKNGVVVET